MGRDARCETFGTGMSACEYKHSPLPKHLLQQAAVLHFDVHPEYPSVSHNVKTKSSRLDGTAPTPTARGTVEVRSLGRQRRAKKGNIIITCPKTPDPPISHRLLQIDHRAPQTPGCTDGVKQYSYPIAQVATELFFAPKYQTGKSCYARARCSPSFL